MFDTDDETPAIPEAAFNCTPGRVYDFGNERLSWTGKSPAIYRLDIESLFYIQMKLEWDAS